MAQPRIKFPWFLGFFDNQVGAILVVALGQMAGITTQTFTIVSSHTAKIINVLAVIEQGPLHKNCKRVQFYRDRLATKSRCLERDAAASTEKIKHSLILSKIKRAALIASAG